MNDFCRYCFNGWHELRDCPLKKEKEQAMMNIRIACGWCGQEGSVHAKDACPRGEEIIARSSKTEKKCECGGEKCGTTHSDWCPKYVCSNV